MCDNLPLKQEAPPSVPPPAQPVRHTLRKWLLRIAVSFLVLMALAYLFRVPLLRGAAWLWIVDEVPVKADAIVVLGGGFDSRPMSAAWLYKEGYAPIVLVCKDELSPMEKLGFQIRECEAAKTLLIKNGIQDSAIEYVGEKCTSTWDEICAVREWAQKSKARMLLISTDTFHTRRVRMAFRKAFADLQCDARVMAVNPPDYSALDWWRSENEIIDFQNEIIKHLYYRFKY